jgi:excinuclease ABC subunit C
MDALLTAETFHDFGHDPYRPYPRPPLARLAASSAEELRAQVRQLGPRQPGVYGMLDAVGRLIYIGKSKFLRSRLLSYFMPNHEDEKAGRIIRSTSEIVWETQPNEFAALLREQQLIRTFRPSFNVLGVPHRQKSVFLCLGREPAATFYVANELDPKAVAWEGPLVGAGRVRRAVDILNRHFRLRDCSNQTLFSFRDQPALFELETRAGCLRHEMRSCLGPCAGGCSRREYQRQVDQAIAYLKGGPSELVTHLEKLMRAAAAGQHYEQAARFREDLHIIRWLNHRLADHARARARFTCVLACQGVERQPIWYLIRRGVVEHAIRAPKTKRGWPAAVGLVRDWSGCDRMLGARYQRREETLAIVAGWFRKGQPSSTEVMFLDDLEKGEHE